MASRTNYRGLGARLASACLLLAIVCPMAFSAPNIVFIMADDLGWSDTSNSLTNLGHPSDFYQTPTLERLAREGMAFTNAYTNGINCAPTRAALLTGQYAQRPTNNVYHVGSLNRGGSKTLLIGPDQGLPSGWAGIPSDSYTYAEMLQAAGYRTAHFGKFHVVDSIDPAADIVRHHGFHRNFGGRTAGGPSRYHARNGKFVDAISESLDPFAASYTQSYVDSFIKPYSRGTDAARIDALVEGNKHVSDALADAAIEFMNQSKSGSFMMQFHPYAVHTPIDKSQARKDLLAKYGELPPGKIDRHVSYAALIEGLDQSVARVVEYLEKTDDPNNPGKKLHENTILFFYSDNGGKRSQSSNGPLKGEKGELDEGGIRVPMIAWSGNPKLVEGGAVNHTPVITIDFYKTFAKLSGAGEPQDVTLDGADLTGILANSSAALAREAIYWHMPGYLNSGGRDQRPQSAIRSGDWKLLYNYEDQSYELYNLSTDIGEATNLAAKNPQRVRDLATKLIGWLHELESPLATVRSGEQTLQFTGTYYANGEVRRHEGGMRVAAGQEMPMVLPD